MKRTTQEGPGQGFLYVALASGHGWSGWKGAWQPGWTVGGGGGMLYVRGLKVVVAGRGAGRGAGAEGFGKGEFSPDAS